MNEEEVLEILTNVGAIRKGHFRLSSGLHTDTYYQCAKVFEHPALTEKFGDEIARLWKNNSIDVVISPAVGGLLLGFAVALSLGSKFIFSEREDGTMTLRRGFSISEGERILVVEDVITTGGSVGEVIELVMRCGGKIAGLASLLSRGRKKEISGLKINALLEVAEVTYQPDECPLDKKGIPLTSPGSRCLKK